MKIYNQLTGRVEEVASKADLVRVEGKLSECLTEAKINKLISDAVYNKPQLLAIIREVLSAEVEGYQALVAKVEYRSNNLDEFLIKAIADRIYIKVKDEVHLFINNIVKQASPDPEQKVTDVEKTA